MRDSTIETEYDLADENISNGKSKFLEVGQANLETAQAIETIYHQKNSGIIKPEDVLMNLILPTVSNRLRYHFESRKSTGLSIENSELGEIDSENLRL